MTKKSQKWIDEEYETDGKRKRKESHRQRRKEKKMKNALRSRNFDVRDIEQMEDHDGY